jgi:hypothetical protein
VPSLKPIRLRGVACVRLVDEVRPKPSWDQRTVATPKAVRARLRMAWTATCGSLAHAWMAMSPPLRSGSRSSPGKCGSGRNASGNCLASPKRSLPSPSRNRLGPKPMVMVSWEGGSPIALPALTASTNSVHRSIGAADWLRT